MAVMKDGKILQVGLPGEVMNHPVNEWVASFVGMETILSGSVIKQNGGTFITSVEGQEIEVVGEVHLGETVVLCIRPENVTLSIHQSKESISARNVFQGRIVKITPLGFYQKVQLDCGFLLIAYITNHSLEELSLAEGKEVRASFKATAVTVMRRGRGEKEKEPPLGDL
jgi:tungstate transport system ATP-binding protein